MKNPIQVEEEIFDAALELTAPDERQAFLDRACRSNSALRSKMELLLSAHQDAERFFTNCISDLKISTTCMDFGEGEVRPPQRTAVDSSLDEALGTSIGPYRILAKIGEGGCGAVYEAEQQHPVRRRVALKVIKLGMDTRAVIARFEAERQALALMDHPNIARVFDAGATREGRPYFVMELVHGVRITDYCDQNRLDTKSRLDLFIQICHAIQHAHQKGIVHRDIKPSNILVASHDGLATPKVIDFGIAKATTDQPLTDKTIVTASEQFIGTPAYMSPEQAGGIDIDTRSDIYSLGVLLYELLTGKTPFDHAELMSAGVDKMRRTLLEAEPHRPSTKLDGLRRDELTITALRRHAEPPKLRSLLRGDLDWIVMKALEKERSRRFETVNGLAVDIQRHLNNEPVLARPPSHIYRFQKWVRRNKILFAATGAVMAALLIGLGASTWLYLGEKQALNRAVAAENQAEMARANETALRHQAEAREKITHASVLVHEAEYEDADKLAIAMGVPQPSMEGAVVFRSLGEWHAQQSRWSDAAQRFAALYRVNELDAVDTTSYDILICGPTLVEAGAFADYEAFRQATVARFARVTNAVIAERVVKDSLLLPASGQLLRALRPLAQVADDFFAANQHGNDDKDKTAWAFISLALMEYRSRAYGKSADYCRQCLASTVINEAREATARVILAMTCLQTGQTGDADTLLAPSRTEIDSRFTPNVAPGDGGHGFWFDWVFARVLLREAEQLEAGAAKGP